MMNVADLLHAATPKLNIYLLQLDLSHAGSWSHLTFHFECGCLGDFGGLLLGFGVFKRLHLLMLRFANELEHLLPLS